MSDYELALILSPELTDASRDEILTKIKELVSSAKGKITKTDLWAKKVLAYQIKKQTQGIYAFLDLELPPASVKDLEKLVKNDEDILRFTVFTKE